MSVTRRENGRWRARVKHKGVIVADRTFDLKRDADLWETEQRRAIALGDLLPAQSTVTVEQLRVAFLKDRRALVSPHTWTTDRDNLRHLPGDWLTRPVSKITQLDVQRHLADLLDVLAFSTTHRVRTSMSALFEYAVRRKLARINPVKGARMPTANSTTADEIDTFTADELALVIERQRATAPWLADVTEFLSLTGLRWGELRALRVGDLQDVPYAAIRVTKSHSDNYDEKSTKNQTRRTVPLTDRAKQIATERAAGRHPDDYLFTSLTGLQLRGNLFYRQTRWSKTTVRGLSLHALRHYFISAALAAGIPVNQVAAWSGHRNAVTLLTIYAHVLGETQERAAIDRLNRHTLEIRVPESAQQ